MNKHKQIKLAFKIVGFVCLGIGLILVLIGFVLLEKYSGRYDPMPLLWFDLIGIPLIGIGVGALRYGFKRGVLEYIEKESAPVINEAAKDMTPAIKTVVTAVREGMAEEDGMTCSCGTENRKESKFCKTCGKPLMQTCPKCGASIPIDSAFCEQCGEKV